jgi:hypothetical protein
MYEKPLIKTSLKQKKIRQNYISFFGIDQSLLNSRGILGSCAPRAALFF